MEEKVKDKCVNRLGLPQSALAFIFIGRESRTPFQVSLYKNFQNKTKPTRITTVQTSRPDRSASEPPELAVNSMSIDESDMHAAPEIFSHLFFSAKGNSSAHHHKCNGVGGFVLKLNAMHGMRVLFTR